MVRSVVLARVHDGLPLAANMDDENVINTWRNYQEFIFRLKEKLSIINTKLV